MPPPPFVAVVGCLFVFFLSLFLCCFVVVFVLGGRVVLKEPILGRLIERDAKRKLQLGEYLDTSHDPSDRLTLKANSLEKIKGKKNCL